MGFFKPNVQKLLAQRDVRGLIKALQSGDLNVSMLAAVALGHIGPDAKAAIPHLKHVLDADKSRGKIGEVYTPTSLKDLKNMEFIRQRYEAVQKALENIQQK